MLIRNLVPGTGQKVFREQLNEITDLPRETCTLDLFVKKVASSNLARKQQITELRNRF